MKVIDVRSPELAGAKFLAPKDYQPVPFIPPESWEVKDKAHKPVIITEGPVKALAVVQAGGLPIGLGGVWMAISKNGDQKDLIDALKTFKWQGRNVYLAFDQDR